MKQFKLIIKNYLDYTDLNIETGKLTIYNINIRKVFSNYLIFEIKMIVIFNKINKKIKVIEKL